MNTCEGCGKPIEKIGICPICDYTREYNRENFTGIPGDMKIREDFLKLREWENEQIQTDSPFTQYADRGIHPNDFISGLDGR